MTVYLVHQKKLSELYFPACLIFTDVNLAESMRISKDLSDQFSYWKVTPIELTTDSFMESVLTKDIK